MVLARYRFFVLWRCWMRGRMSSGPEQKINCSPVNNIWSASCWRTSTKSSNFKKCFVRFSKLRFLERCGRVCSYCCMRLLVTRSISRAGNVQTFTVAIKIALCALQSLHTFSMLMNSGFIGAYFLVCGRPLDFHGTTAPEPRRLQGQCKREMSFN